MTWRLDHRKAGAIAAQAWGLRWPVRFQRRRWKRWAGWHFTAMNTWRGPTHIVRFDGTHGMECALRTIAHELEHAAQNERIGVSAFRHCYLTDGPGFERLAGKAENRWRELLPAVKGAP